MLRLIMIHSLEQWATILYQTLASLLWLVTMTLLLFLLISTQEEHTRTVHTCEQCCIAWRGDEGRIRLQVGHTLFTPWWSIYCLLHDVSPVGEMKAGTVRYWGRLYQGLIAPCITTLVSNSYMAHGKVSLIPRLGSLGMRLRKGQSPLLPHL